MSAYVVEPETIWHIVETLTPRGTNRYDWEWFCRDLWTEYDLLSDDGSAKLAQEMWQMNIVSVCQRYDDVATDDYDAVIPVRLVSPTTSVQLYKSLNCYLYQCYEGNVPNLALYQLLDKVRYHLAGHIVDNLPQYDRAEWA